VLGNPYYLHQRNETKARF
jgi:hypothetical protein